MVHRLCRFMRCATVAAVSTLSALLISLSAHAAGALDVSFGSGGRASYALNGGSQSSAQALAVLPEGKMVLVGFCTSQAAADYCCADSTPTAAPTPHLPPAASQ